MAPSKSVQRFPDAPTHQHDTNPAKHKKERIAKKGALNFWSRVLDRLGSMARLQIPPSNKYHESGK
jgi:hypothetical protein